MSQEYVDIQVSDSSGKKQTPSRRVTATKTITTSDKSKDKAQTSGVSTSKSTHKNQNGAAPDLNLFMRSTPITFGSSSFGSTATSNTSDSTGTTSKTTLPGKSTDEKMLNLMSKFHDSFSQFQKGFEASCSRQEQSLTNLTEEIKHEKILSTMMSIMMNMKKMLIMRRNMSPLRPHHITLLKVMLIPPTKGLQQETLLTVNQIRK
jgi:hypothetical protein